MPAQDGTWFRDERDNRFDRVIEGLLIALLAFAPLAFGAVEAWSEEIVIVLAAAVSTCFLLKMAVTRRAFVVWTWAYVAIIAFLIVTILQLVPLPMVCLRLLSPQTAARKLELLRDLESAALSPSFMRISFYSHASLHNLRLVLAVVAVFAVVLNVFRRPDQIIRLLVAVAVIGTGIAVIALGQDILGNGKIYWFVAIPHDVAHSGPFVNHSHYAQFMNLSIGAMLGVIFVRMHQLSTRCRLTPVNLMEYLASPDARNVWALSAAAVVGAATIFVSLSRGGIISMMIAGAFTALVLSPRRSVGGPGWIMAALALGAFICVLYIGFDAVYDRLGTLWELQAVEGSRWQIVKDIAVAWSRFPVMGTGLGTHEVVYPMFDRATVPAIASHAENEYAQAAEETGLLGLAALTTFGAFVWSRYARSVRTVHHPIQAAAYGLGFGLIAIMVHSLSDFGQHVPANALLSGVFCALLIRLARIDADGADTAGEVVLSGKHARYSGVIGLVIAGLVWGWALLDADAARRGETHWANTLSAERDLMNTNWKGSKEEYTYLLREADRARACQPGSIKYRHWLNVYRWQATSRLADPNAAGVVLPPEGLEFVDRITRELKQALSLCPTFGSTWCVLGQLERLIAGRDEEGKRHIERGRALAPYDSTTCFVAAMLHAEEGNMEAAYRDFQRAVQLEPRRFREAALELIKWGRPDLAMKLAPTNSSQLVQLEEILLDSGESPELLTDVQRDLQELLEQECREPDAPAWKFAWLGQRYGSQNRIDEAIEMYRKALAIQYDNVSWRFALAQLLVKKDLISEAIRELEIILRLQPQFEPARELLEQLLLQIHGDVNSDQ